MWNLDFLKEDINVEVGLFGKRKGTMSKQERILGGEYDQNTLYTYMKMSQ
jgi:hypothetical protein